MASTPQFTLIPAGDRERYVPITYYQAINGARASAAFGLDLFADPVCRVALETAREQDRPVLSGRLHSSAPGRDGARVFLFLPVFEPAPPTAGGDRTSVVEGKSGSGLVELGGRPIC